MLTTTRVSGRTASSLQQMLCLAPEEAALPAGRQFAQAAILRPQRLSGKRAAPQHQEHPPNGILGWLLRCKSFLAISAVVFVSTVVCAACLRGGVRLALMNSANEVPIGVPTLEEGR